MMRKALLPVLPALIAGALLAIPAIATADNGVTHDCGTADCTGATWVSQPTVAFSWPATATDPSDGCNNGQPISPPEGDDTLVCSVTLEDGVTVAKDTVHIKVDNTPPTAAPGVASVPASPFGWWRTTPLAIDFA